MVMNYYLEKMKSTYEAVKNDIAAEYIDEKDFDNIKLMETKLRLYNMNYGVKLSDEDIKERLNCIKNYYKIFKEDKETIERHMRGQAIINNDIKTFSDEMAGYKDEVSKLEEILNNEDTYPFVKKEKGKVQDYIKYINEDIGIANEGISKRNEQNAEYNRLWENLYYGKGLDAKAVEEKAISYEEFMNEKSEILSKHKEILKKGLKYIDKQRAKAEEKNIKNRRREKSKAERKKASEERKKAREERKKAREEQEEKYRKAEKERNEQEKKEKAEKKAAKKRKNQPEPEPELTPEEIAARIKEANDAKYDIVLNNNGVELTINDKKIKVDEHRIRTIMELQKENPKKFMDLIGRYSGITDKEFKDVEEARNAFEAQGIDIDKFKEIDPMVIACADKLRVLKENEKGTALLNRYLMAYEGKATSEELDKLNITYDLDDLSKRARLLQRAFTTKNYFTLQNKKEIIERAEVAKDKGIANVTGDFTPALMDKFFDSRKREEKKPKLLGKAAEYLEDKYDPVAISEKRKAFLDSISVNIDADDPKAKKMYKDHIKDMKKQAKEDKKQAKKNKNKPDDQQGR